MALRRQPQESHKTATRQSQDSHKTVTKQPGDSHKTVRRQSEDAVTDLKESLVGGAPSQRWQDQEPDEVKHHPVVNLVLLLEVLLRALQPRQPVRCRINFKAKRTGAHFM